MQIKDWAVCIRAVDYSDTSQVLTLFCRESGKLGVIAKGSKRPQSPFGGTIEVFSHGGIVCSGRGEGKLLTLTEFDRQGEYFGLRRRLEALNCAFLAIELLGSLTTDNDPLPELYDDLLQLLGNLEKTNDKQESLKLLVLFQLGLLSRLGIKPDFGRCANCGTSGIQSWSEVYYSSAAGGMVCRNCEGSYQDKMRVSRDTAICLNDCKRIVEATNKIINESEEILIYHFTGIMHHPPLMAKHFIQQH